MKVIKIIKHFRNGTIEKHLVITDESLTHEDINDTAEQWCESDVSGKVYGYSYEWKFEEDETTIKDVIKRYIFDLISSIETLQRKKDKLIKYLSDYESKNCEQIEK